MAAWWRWFNVSLRSDAGRKPQRAVDLQPTYRRPPGGSARMPALAACRGSAAAFVKEPRLFAHEEGGRVRLDDKGQAETQLSSPGSGRPGVPAAE